MSVNKIWVLTLAFLSMSLATGRFAIFTNGGNGNGGWYLLFWLFCTGLFMMSGWLLAKSLKVQRLHMPPSP